MISNEFNYSISNILDGHASNEETVDISSNIALEIIILSKWSCFLCLYCQFYYYQYFCHGYYDYDYGYIIIIFVIIIIIIIIVIIIIIIIVIIIIIIIIIIVVVAIIVVLFELFQMLLNLE